MIPESRKCWKKSQRYGRSPNSLAKALLERYATPSPDLRLPPYDEFARYCIKTATGSGKVETDKGTSLRTNSATNPRNHVSVVLDERRSVRGSLSIHNE
jgi:hypothetical protein